jgi:hypothetical protein
MVGGGTSSGFVAQPLTLESSAAEANKRSNRPGLFGRKDKG